MDEKNQKISYTAPLTNRGVVCTSKSGLFLLFDWVQATFFPDTKKYSIYDIFFYLFGVEKSDVLLNEKCPHFGYTSCYSYRDICIMLSDIRSDLGYHLYMTGSACREFEELGLDYKHLFNKLYKLNVHFTRVDVSIDDFTGKYFPFDKIKKCVLDCTVISNFRTSIEFVKTNLTDSDNIGYTIWFGTRASDVQFVFYDKLKERIYNANCEIIQDNLKHWNRFEMRYRNDYADTIILNYVNLNDFQSYMFGLINNYISFRIKNESDSNKRRWKLQSWWNRFVGSYDKIQFQRVPVEYSIVRKKGWFLSTCSSSTFEVLISDLEDVSIDSCLSSFLYEFLKKGSDDVTDLDLQLINQFRIKKNLQPLNRVEVIDFIKNIKDVIIQKK